MIELVVALVVFGGLLVLGFSIGTTIERQHFRSLDRREHEMAGMLASQVRSFPQAAARPEPTIITAEVVISSDYFKSFLASFKRLIGGELDSFRSLMERARREAEMRVREQARALGYNAICNLRLDAADITGAESNTKGVVLVAILATATAYHATV